ncbi:A24 family peptidase [Vibrio sp. S4M6]|uniref:prepilin peptidase n=1 Tax=Vibrio sinus TaxID=2946865 RepID=UPI002029CFB8|nr:A24 family peptidase [Vibrio sinus]MCL9781037.1 A24 family peptidase [Vibrio sinus]
MEAIYYYPWMFTILATIFGLIIGSFLNVVIARLPKMMEQEWRDECAESFPEYKITPTANPISLSSPRSNCPKCGTKLRIIDNIPIISWLMLKGKCHHCQQSISARYPIVELLSAVMSYVVAVRFGASWYAIAVIVLTFALIAATFIDFDTLLLPDQITLPLMWLGIMLALWHISPVSLYDSVLGAISGYLFLWFLYWAFKLITGKEGMGYGDFKLLAALGAWLGWQYLPIVILLSSVVGLIFGLIQLRLQSKGHDHAFPFGPYLSIAGWISIVWGEQIIHWYFGAVFG